MQEISELAFRIMEVMSFLFLIAIGLGVLWIVYAYIIDKFQKRSTLRRNFPVLARFRYTFESLGEFLRQYFFAQDREEMPFNRAERSWCYRAAKNVDSTVAFGSTKDLRHAGTVYFVNSTFPPLEEDFRDPDPILIGPHCRKPYGAASFFNISGMSYGAISLPAIRALSRGAKEAGIWLNTGEGGLSPYHLESGCDLVFQIGTAKFGVRNSDGGFDEDKLRDVAGYEQVRMFEIKLSQGAKPGKGGILPGVKVTPEIARIRGIEPGLDAISPNRHPEINTVDDLLDVIHYVREITGKPVGFKTVVGHMDFFDQLCTRIHERGIEGAPDFITIDSADGGSGAAPMSLIDNVGIPIKESLPQVVDVLEKYKLRERIRLCASGKLVTPAEVAWALCAGADFVNSARGFMFALGCIQSLQCNKNTCPTGITTHDRNLQYGLHPEEKSVRVAHYARNICKEVGVIAHSCGVADPHLLTRKHARIVTEDGRSLGMDKFYSSSARTGPE